MNELKEAPDLGPIMSSLQINVHLSNEDKGVTLVVNDVNDIGADAAILLLKEAVKVMEKIVEENQKLVT